jgi:hypothetical protein
MSVFLSDLLKDQQLDFIGLQETMEKYYTTAFFRKIEPENAFFWKWIPSVGKSGGILCGAKNETLGVQAVKLGDFMVLMSLWGNVKKCKSSIIVVYGPAHEERKTAFLVEMASFCNAVD